MGDMLGAGDPMAFGRNPHVPKAQAAEQKAADAPDDAARARAHRDAARQWERAAEREPPGKRRVEYEQNAEKNRRLAGGGEPGGGEPDEGDGDAGPVVDPKLLN
jgi:hypothetical protein